MAKAIVIEGDCRQVLASLDAESVQTCITSPPYFGLRDYEHGGQIGNERNLLEYVIALRDVFRRVRRVLRDDGTLWLNLGDCYDSRKNLIGVPWKVAERLKQEGWILRSEIIWAKPNPMPESVRDRPTKAHENLFLLVKSGTYFYDADAIREDAESFGRQGSERDDTGEKNAAIDVRWHKAPLDRYDIPGRNKRSVWTVATQPFAGTHFATFPSKLIEPCVLAGSRPGDTVLDPFNGAGTTGVVALRHDRNYIGIELNPDYAQMARDRIYDDGPLLNEVAA